MTKKKIIIIITSIVLSIAYILYFVHVNGNIITGIIGLAFLIVYLATKKSKTRLFITGNMAEYSPGSKFNEKSFEPVGNILYIAIAIVFLIKSVI